MITPSIKEHQLDMNQLRHQLGTNHRSVIFMSVCVQFELEPHLYQSVIFHVSTRLSFSGLHLYRSIIHLVNWVESYLVSSRAYLVESVRPWATLYPPFEFMAHILVMLLGAPCLSFSCSTRIVIPFGRIFSCTPRWFDRYSYLIFTFESLLEMS